MGRGPSGSARPVLLERHQRAIIVQEIAFGQASR
jgi:hypothetical protein